MSQQVLSEVYAAANEASVRAAASAMNALGGGIVHLPAGVITITSSLPIYANVSYVGAGVSEDMGTHSIVGGTIIDGGGGAFNGFEWNPTDKGSPYASLALLQASEAKGVQIRNLGIRNCAYGIKAGGLYNGGLHGAVIDNVVITGCSQWGAWLENCHNLSIGRIVLYDGVVGQFCSLASGNTLWNYGNDSIGQIIAQCVETAIHARGVVIGARGSSQRNDLYAAHITSIGGGATYTTTPTCTNGLPSLGVTDLSKFALGVPVTFQGAAAGFFANVTYFVVAASAASGAGTIQLSNTPHGTAINATSTGSTGVLVAKGGAAIELGGLDASSYIYNGKIGYTDTENCGVCDIYAFNFQGDLHTGTTTAASTTYQSQITTRSCDFRMHIVAGQKYGSIDIDSPTVRLDGVYYGTLQNQNVPGLRYDQTYSGMALWLDGKGKAFYPPDTTFVLNPIGTSRALADKPSYIASGATVDSTYGSHIVYTGAGGGSITLPAVFLQVCGLKFKIVNPSSGTLTVNTTSSQTINNVGATTSFVIAANSAADVSACQTSAASGTFFWSKQ